MVTQDRQGTHFTFPGSCRCVLASPRKSRQNKETQVYDSKLLTLCKTTEQSPKDFYHER